MNSENFQTPKYIFYIQEAFAMILATQHLNPLLSFGEATPAP